MIETIGKWGEVDFLVVGDCPSALWLLSELPEVYAGTASVGWLRDSKPVKKLYVAKSAVKSFALKGTTPVSSEVLWPHDGMPWSVETVGRRFPKLQLPAPGELAAWCEAPINLSPDQWRRGLLDTKWPVSAAAAHYPELMAFAEAFWKLFGRTEKAPTENKIWNLFQCLALEEWAPENQLPAGTEVFICDRLGSDISSVRQTADRHWEVTVNGRGTLHTAQLILALTARQLQALSGAFKLSRLPWNGVVSPPFSSGLYPLRVDLESHAVPLPMKDLTFLLDSIHLPEPSSEIWPIEKRQSATAGHCELTLWATGRFENSLDTLAQTYQQAAKRLNLLLPFSSRSVKSYIPGLSFDECSRDEVRGRIYAQLADRFVERFAFSLMEPRTRWPGLFFAGPYCYTQWPYPLGELRAADQIKSLLKPTKKQLEKIAKKSVPVALTPPAG